MLCIVKNQGIVNFLLLREVRENWDFSSIDSFNKMSASNTKELYPSVAGVNVAVISNSTRHAYGTSKVFLQLVNSRKLIIKLESRS